MRPATIPRATPMELGPLQPPLSRSRACWKTHTGVAVFVAPGKVPSTAQVPATSIGGGPAGAAAAAAAARIRAIKGLGLSGGREGGAGCGGLVLRPHRLRQPRVRYPVRRYVERRLRVPDLAVLDLEQ